MIIGHVNIVEYLEKVWRRGTVSQGYLFHGPRNVGKTTAALAFARALLCEEGERFGGCLPLQVGGECPTCQRFARGAEPRFVKLELGGSLLGIEKEKTEIGVKEVQEMRRRLSLKAAGWQIVMVADAEHLSHDASGALLKILEEPGERVLFIFVSSRPLYIVSTIRSRLVLLRFSRVPDCTMREIPGATKELVELAGGRPGILLSLLLDADFKKREMKTLSIAERIAKSSPGGAIVAAESFFDDDLLRESVVYHLCRIALQRIQEEADALPRTYTARVRRALSVFELLETTNVNRRLATDIIAMNFTQKD